MHVEDSIEIQGGQAILDGVISIFRIPSIRSVILYKHDVRPSTCCDILSPYNALVTSDATHVVT